MTRAPADRKWIFPCGGATVYAWDVAISDAGPAEKIIEERGLRVPMRDGVRLSADVWRPATDEPVPVLVCRR